jgi:hypothetical protein
MYSMQMERMGSSSSRSTHKNEFDGLVTRKRVYGTRRQEVLSILSTAQNLQENRDRRGLESNVVDKEFDGGKIEIELERNDNVSITEGRTSWSRWRIQRMEICQVELTARTQRLVGGFLVGSTDITEDCRVDAIVKGGICSVVRLSTNPVIVDGLVGIENKGVSLGSENLHSIHSNRLSIHSVGLDNREIMTLNGEDIVWIAAQGYEAESVAFALLHRNDCKVRCRLEGSSVT